MFWDLDTPVARADRAFDPLATERQAPRLLSVAAYELRMTLPSPPPSLDVFVVGSYPSSEAGRVSLLGEHWEFVPSLSLVQYVGSSAPLGSPAPLVTDADAMQRARTILLPYGLLPADTSLAGADKGSDGGWRVRFARRIDGYADYANKGLTVTFDAGGRVRNILGRRRPLLERSRYATRPVQEAWQLVESGRWRSFYVNDGAPDPRNIGRFIATSLEIAYVEGEVLGDRDVMRPYYVFRDANGQTLYVSAIEGDVP